MRTRLSECSRECRFSGMNWPGSSPGPRSGRWWPPSSSWRSCSASRTGRWRETFISLVPIALTVVMLLGFIAFAGIQLNLVTAIASSIVIGVGIDYAIHFIAAIDHARAEGDGYVLRAIERAGRPIVANALGIALGLTALWLSPLKPHSQISMIMWVAMLTAAGPPCWSFLHCFPVTPWQRSHRRFAARFRDSSRPEPVRSAQ